MLDASQRHHALSLGCTPAERLPRLVGCTHVGVERDLPPRFRSLRVFVDGAETERLLELHVFRIDSIVVLRKAGRVVWVSSLI